MSGVLTNMIGRPAVGGGSDPDFSSTKLLLGFEGADASTTFTDESAAARGNATVFSGAQVDTAQFKYGASSILLNGTSDYITYAQNADWDFGSGAFTIEMFVRFNAVGTDIAFVGNRDGSALGWRFLRNSSNLTFASAIGTLSVAWTPSTGQWYHLAVDRVSAGKCRTYVDGAMHGSVTSASAITNSSIGLAVGRLPSAAIWYHNGWIDELRITKGVARYASDSGFTVPAAAYPRS